MRTVKKVAQHHLDEKRLAIAMGSTCAIALFFLGAFSALYGIGDDVLLVMSSLFHGYGGTPVGVGIGVIWGLIDGAIFGFLFAWIYNNANVD